jgi:hypothetical protein
MWKISGIFTLHHTVLRCTECLSTLTETGGARITIAVPPFSILIYLTAILTGELHWILQHNKSNDRTCGTTLVWIYDRIAALWSLALDRVTHWLSILTGAGVTCTQLPGVSLIVASIAHCASMSAWRQARGAAFSLQHIELVTVTPNWWTAVSVT